MGNCILAFPNRVDSSFYPVAFSGGAWAAAMPLENLRDPLLVRVARSASLDPADTWFDVDMGVARDIRVCAIPKGTVGRKGMVRLRGANTPDFAAPLVDTGWRDWWRVIYGEGTLPWEHPSAWDGKVTEEDAEGYAMPFVHVLPQPVNARWWRIEIDDGANPAGHIDLARLFLAPGWQPSINLSYGNGLGWEDETTREASLGGARFHDPRPRRRVARLAIKHLPLDEALAWPWEMQRLLGTHRQAFFVFDPDDTTHLHRRAFLATLRRLSPLEMAAAGRESAEFELEEVIA